MFQWPLTIWVHFLCMLIAPQRLARSSVSCNPQNWAAVALSWLWGKETKHTLNSRWELGIKASTLNGHILSHVMAKVRRLLTPDFQGTRKCIPSMLRRTRSLDDHITDCRADRCSRPGQGGGDGGWVMSSVTQQRGCTWGCCWYSCEDGVVMPGSNVANSHL